MVIRKNPTSRNGLPAVGHQYTLHLSNTYSLLGLAGILFGILLSESQSYGKFNSWVIL